MQLLELYNLREKFWTLNRQELVVFVKITKGEDLRGQPDKLLDGVDRFLLSLFNEAKDPELKAEIASWREKISTLRSSPFAHL